MNRVTEERLYWTEAAEDPEVDVKYICDMDDAQFFKALGKLPDPVLELGWGVGRLMKPGYIGVDISRKMLSIGRKRHPGCRFVLCNGREIPMESNSFGSVYCVLVFQHIPEEGVKSYLSEIHRILKKNGVFRFQFVEGHEHEPFSHKYSIDEMDFWTQRAGFTITQIDEKLIHPQWVWFTAVKE